MRIESHTRPILLFDDQCAVCRHIASWVHKLARDPSGHTTIVDRPIGNDPVMLRTLNPALDIWDAYATIHVVMPDASLKLGGEAVAEVLRQLPETRWFTRIFAIGIFGFRPFQAILNLAYATLADVRPLFGCESCGTPVSWVRPIRWLIKRAGNAFGATSNPNAIAHFTPLAVSTPRSPSMLQSDNAKSS